MRSATSGTLETREHFTNNAQPGMLILQNQIYVESGYFENVNRLLEKLPQPQQSSCYHDSCAGADCEPPAICEFDKAHHCQKNCVEVADCIDASSLCIT